MQSKRHATPDQPAFPLALMYRGPSDGAPFIGAPVMVILAMHLSEAYCSPVCCARVLDKHL